MAPLFGVKRRSRSILVNGSTRQIGHRARHARLLDAAGDLRPQRLVEAEFVEHEAGDAGGAVGIEQAALDAGRGQPLVHALHAQRRGERREAQIERRELHLDAAFLLLVGEGLLDAVEAAFVGELVVLVVGVAEPEPDRVDAGGLRAVFAAAGDLGLVHVDAGVGLGRFQTRHAIEARVARHRDADKSLLEDVGAADRLPVRAHRRVRLPPVERQRLVARRQIGIARDAVVVGAPAERVGMEGEIAGAGIEDDGAIEAVVDAGEGAAHLVLQARPGHGGGPDRLHGHAVAARLRLRRAGQRVGDPVVGRVDHAADRLRAPAQRRRAAHHLDPFGRQRIERHGVILAELRHAARADAVLLDAHAIGIEAAHDRAARRAGREARAGDAGLGEQDVAERAAAVALQFLAGDHRDGGELVGDDREPAGRQLGAAAGGVRASPGGGRRRRRGGRRGAAAPVRSGSARVTTISGSCWSAPPPGARRSRRRSKPQRHRERHPDPTRPP